MTEQSELEKNTGRLEAFSDGVFSVAITLLVVSLAVPEIELGGPWNRERCFMR